MVPTPWSRLSKSVARDSPAVLMRGSVNEFTSLDRPTLGPLNKLVYIGLGPCANAHGKLTTIKTSSSPRGDVAGSGGCVKRATDHFLSRSNMPSSAPGFTG